MPSSRRPHPHARRRAPPRACYDPETYETIRELVLDDGADALEAVYHELAERGEVERKYDPEKGWVFRILPQRHAPAPHARRNVTTHAPPEEKAPRDDGAMTEGDG